MAVLQMKYCISCLDIVIIYQPYMLDPRRRRTVERYAFIGKVVTLRPMVFNTRTAEKKVAHCGRG